MVNLILDSSPFLPHPVSGASHGVPDNWLVAAGGDSFEKYNFLFQWGQLAAFDSVFLPPTRPSCSTVSPSLLWIYCFWLQTIGLWSTPLSIEFYLQVTLNYNTTNNRGGWLRDPDKCGSKKVAPSSTCSIRLETARCRCSRSRRRRYLIGNHHHPTNGTVFTYIKTGHWLVTLI